MEREEVRGKSNIWIALPKQPKIRVSTRSGHPPTDMDSIIGWKSRRSCNRMAYCSLL